MIPKVVWKCWGCGVPLDGEPSFQLAHQIAYVHPDGEPVWEYRSFHKDTVYCGRLRRLFQLEVAA